jgi:hypothetical protein
VSLTPSTSTTASVAFEDRFLSDLQPTRQKGCGRPQAGDVTIAGTLYARSVTIVAQKCTGGGTNYIEYTVPEGCETFSAVLGLPDTSADDDVALIEATMDAGQRRTIKARRSTGTSVTFPLAGALHVRLTMQNLGSAGFRDVTAGRRSSQSVAGQRVRVPGGSSACATCTASRCRCVERSTPSA